MLCPYITIDSLINLSMGSSLLFYSIGLNHKLQKEEMDKCSHLNLNIGTTMGAVSGALVIYKSIKH